MEEIHMFRLLGTHIFIYLLASASCATALAQTVDAPSGNAVGHDNNGQMIVINPPKAAPTTTIEATYKVCVAGEREQCPTGTVFIFCGQRVADWAAKECSTYTQALLEEG